MKDEISADAIFKRIEKQEIKKLKKLCMNKNAYDIQTACLEWSKKDLQNVLQEKEILKIKDIAFKNGILLEDLYVILGIMMRDSILNELGIHISKVDEDASNNGNSQD